MIANEVRELDIDETIEATLKEMGIAPSLRSRARENLLAQVREKGLGSVVSILEAAQHRGERARAWLSSSTNQVSVKKRNVIEIKSYDPINAQKKAWSALARHAQLKSDRQWAQFVLKASNHLSNLDEDAVRRNTAAAELACISLIEAADKEDFQTESVVVRGAVFAETANLYAICAKVTREMDFIVRGLELYSIAAELIGRVEAPTALATVQINRGTALACYAHMLQKVHVEKFEKDILEVVSFLDETNKIYDASNEYTSVARSIRGQLGIFAEFNGTTSSWNKWGDLGRFSLSIPLQNEIEFS